MAIIWRTLCTLFGILVAISGALLGFIIFPNILNDKVKDGVKLMNGSEAFKRWVEIPFPLQFQIYFFNVTNPDSVKKGSLPIVKEIGPYTYDEKKVKDGILYENDILSYKQRQSFSFNETASGIHTKDDDITIANLLMMSIASVSEEDSTNSIMVNKCLNDLFGNNNDLFIKTTPKKFLFDGIFLNCNEIKKGSKCRKSFLKLICNKIKDTKSRQLESLEDGQIKFSFLSFKNKSNDVFDSFKINSGLDDIKSLGEIVSWRNSSKLNIWKDENSTCNNIYGSDSTIYPPHVTVESKINVFQMDICRSVNLHFKNRIEYKGIDGYKFTIERDMLDSGSTIEKNKCFCLNKTKGITGKDGCLLDGALELYNCLNSPIVLTFPHFLDAHEKYQKSVQGFNPNKTLHETFVELEEMTGTVLQGNKRVQFNIFYRKIENIELTYNLNQSLMPVLWLDEGVQLPDKYIKLLDDKRLFVAVKVTFVQFINWLKWSLIGVGSVVTVISVILFLL